jgi:GTP cyclohydrolase I
LSEALPEKQEVDRARIERAVREILISIGEDPDREGLLGTPERVADAYAYLFAGLGEDPTRHLEVGFMESARDTVLIRASCRSSAGLIWATPRTAGSSGSPSWRGSWRATPVDRSSRSG